MDPGSVEPVGPGRCFSCRHRAGGPGETGFLRDARTSGRRSPSGVTPDPGAERASLPAEPVLPASGSAEMNRAVRGETLRNEADGWLRTERSLERGRRIRVALPVDAERLSAKEAAEQSAAFAAPLKRPSKQ